MQLKLCEISSKLEQAFYSPEDHFSAQNRGLPLRSGAPTAQPRVKQAHLRSFLDLLFTKKRMGLSRKLYKQALLPFRPTEATSQVLKLILILFTARVTTFETLFTQLLFFFLAADPYPGLTSLKYNQKCASTPSGSNKRFTALIPPFFS